MNKTPLGRYFAAHPGLTHAAFSETSDIPIDTVRGYVHGRRRPTIDNALAIQKATDGEVPVEAWRNSTKKRRAA